MNKNDRKAHIHFGIIFRLAVANLKFKRFRSFITIVGVTIGIGSIYLLLSFGLGLQNLVQGEVAGNKSIETIDVTSPDPTILKLSPENIEKIGAIKDVTQVSGLNILAGQVELGSSTLDTVVYGVDAAYFGLANLQMVNGGFIDPSKDSQVMMSQYLVESLGVESPEAAVGSEIKLKLSLGSDSQPLTALNVSGVTASDSSGLEVFVSRKFFEDAKIVDVDQVKLAVKDRESIEEVRRTIESFGFDTSSPVDTLDQVNEVFKIFNLILAGLGGIGLVIAVLGMLNTLTVSLLERTREIALMIMLGARPRDMKRLFMIEALLLSIIGGLSGVALASLAGTAVNFVLNRLAQSRGVSYYFDIFYHSPLLIALMIGLITIIGLTVSFVPSRRASRINPIDALRHE